MSGVSYGQRGLCAYLQSLCFDEGIYLFIMLCGWDQRKRQAAGLEPALLSSGCSAVIGGHKAFGPQFLTLGLNSRNPVRTQFLVWTDQLGKISLLHHEGDFSTGLFVGFNKDRLLGGLEGRFILKVHFVSLNFC